MGDKNQAILPGTRLCPMMEVKENDNSGRYTVPQTTPKNEDCLVGLLQFCVVVITQEDLNSKFLRSLPPEWNTHVVVWMNKADIETMSIDDLYNNFKIVKQDVKKSVGASSGAQNLAFMTTPSTSSTNDVNTANPAYEVSTVSPNINTACPQVSTANFSDNTVFEVAALSAKVLQLSTRWDTLPGNVEHKEQRGSFRISRQQLGSKDTMKPSSQRWNSFAKKLGAINVLKSKFEKVKQEKEGIEFKIEKFDNASKSLDKLLGSQITDKSKKGLGHPEFKSYGSEDSKQESNIVCDNNKMLLRKILMTLWKVLIMLQATYVNTIKGKGGTYCDIAFSQYQKGKRERNGGYVTLGGGAHGGRISDINQFFPPSKTTYLRNEITTFYQKPNETFNEAWEHFKGLIRQCPHYGFSELHQLDTFYNSLNTNDQDALDSAVGGNFLDKMPREGLAIIESKSKVRYSRSRPNDSRASTNAPSSTSSPSNNSFEIQQMAALLEDKMDIRMSRLEKMISEKNVTTPATVKAVEEVCVTCGSNHNFNNCPLTRNDFPVFHDNIHQFQQTAVVGNFVQRNPPNLANLMRPPDFNQSNVQNNQGNPA
ncbi:reverse transcriptase domain-containing protein [Tanacetum coccineum]